MSVGAGSHLIPNRARFALAALVVLAATIFCYWRLPQGAFVWDDIVCLQGQPWLLQPGAWQRVFSSNFLCDVPNYFRPLAAALLTLEVRTFDMQPGPMHLVSLLLHLVNTALVGWLAVLSLGAQERRRSVLIACIPAALYALHPALVEPVAWIMAQNELLLTLFTLLGLAANATVRGPARRACAVALCFLLAALSKESAIAFPILVFLCDWLRERATTAPAARLRAVWRAHWRTYAAVLLAGLAYLALRRYRLGYFVGGGIAEAHSIVAQVQEICSLYLTYWRMLVWPMVDLNPVHLVPASRFSEISALSAGTDIAAFALAAYGFVAWLKGKPSGLLIAAVSAQMLPVLHLLPLAFDESLYHERYVMAPLALALALLPDVVAPWIAGIRLRQFALGLVGLVWLAFALVNIRVTLPLWADDVSLWQWALQRNPESISVRENLFAAYVTHEDPRAHEFARRLAADPLPCPTCLLNVAYYGMREHDPALAASALMRLEQSGALASDARLFAAQRVATARLLDQQGDPAQAELAYRAAIDAVPDEAQTRFELALLLAREGKRDEARRVGDAAIGAFPAPQRDEQRRRLEQALGETPGRQP